MDTPNPSVLSLPKTQMSNSTPKRQSKIPRHQTGEKFLKGPIPLRWILIAAKLPGKSWHVASAIWFLAGLNNSPRVKLNQSILYQFGVSRYSKYRALSDLEGAGLIAIEHSKGKNPTITLLDPGMKM